MNTTKKAILVVTALVGPALLCCCGCGSGGKDGGTQTVASQHVKVRARAPEKHLFEERVSVQGTVEAVNTAEVSARVPGNLDEIWVDEGDSVVKGETKLFQIDPVNLSNQVVVCRQAVALARSNLNVAEAGLVKIKAEAEKASLDFARYERLRKDGRVSENEFEMRQTANAQAKAGVEVGVAQVELAKQQIDQALSKLVIAEKQLSDSLIIAPISGKVASRRAEPGEFIAAGRSILSLVDVEHLEVAAFLPAKYFPSVTSGQTDVTVSIAAGEESKTKVSFKNPVVNTALRTFEIKCPVAYSEGTAPGMMANLSVVFQSHEGLGVPADAVLTRSGRKTVFAVREGKARNIPVETGMETDGFVEIVSGLSESDSVIVEGHTLVRDGQFVDVLHQ